MSLVTAPPRVMSLQEQRVRVQQLEKQIQAEFDAAKKVLDIECKAARVSCFVGRTVPKPGPTLESMVEREQRKLCTLIEQHNELKFTLRGKESRLMELQQIMRSLEMDTAPTDDGEKYVQLENILENINLKITEAKKILSTYLKVREHLQQEEREISHGLDKLQHTVLSGHAELSKVAMMSQTALTAVDSTKSAVLQMEQQVLAMRRAAKQQPREERVEEEYEAEACAEGEREGERHSARLANGAREPGGKGAREVLAELTNPAAVKKGQNTMGQPRIPQSVVKLIEDIDGLKDALSCTDLQELETRLVSQNAVENQLLSHMARCEGLVEKRQQDLETLELQYAQLKFNTSQGSGWYERLKAGLEDELSREQERSDQWESRLAKAETVLRVIEQSIDNLYYRMSCLMVKPQESPREGGLDATDKLMEILASLGCLASVNPQPVEESGLDLEKMWGFLVQSTMMEPRNFKCVSSPVHSIASKETLQFRSHEEDCPLSRDELKRRSLQVLEAHQPKKKVQKGPKKS